MQANPDQVVRRADPLNCEVRLSRLAEGSVTPNERFYIRNHFPVPSPVARTWRLKVHGLVNEPLSMSLPELMRMRGETIPVTLECAGNGRSLFNPPIEGEPWSLGAVSSAEWTGIPIFEVLDKAGLGPNANHLVFRSVDGFERALSIEEAREGPTLLAFGMNGEPLPPVHGYPLRVIVPAWYAVASVKWVSEIEVTDHPFDGHFQVQRYIYESSQGTQPVKYQKVRSVITEPEDGETIPAGDVVIRGVAWSGAFPLGQVHLSIDQGEWLQATLQGLPDRYAWRLWQLETRIDRRGPVTIRARATDINRESQPEQAEWNRLGYGNNSIQTVTVTIS
ncbi:MAG TPA: sulfite oxidase [Candidatus Dormibacteraeota bacterium]|nr:sulfite oxidase [Candidatus Dormibacteraeota bacterium]